MIRADEKGQVCSAHAKCPYTDKDCTCMRDGVRAKMCPQLAASADQRQLDHDERSGTDLPVEDRQLPESDHVCPTCSQPYRAEKGQSRK